MTQRCWPNGCSSPSGKAPCLSAHLEDRVVLATADIMARRWPIFHSELRSNPPYQAIVSVPIDSDEFGAAAAVDLYYTDPQPAYEPSRTANTPG